MAYIEAFLYYIAVVMFMFIVLFGGVVLIYMILGQFKIFFAKEEVTPEIEKAFLYKLIKNRFFKWSILAYFSAFTFFYINQAIKYFGGDRAYPRAKAYAIAADTLFFWHSVGVNIAISRGWGEYDRLIRPEDKLDTKIQKVQDFFLSKMYQYIPETDGEREMWYYKYKQLYMAKIRYLPDSIHNPHPRLSNIMDSMYDTTYKLYSKPIKDKEFDKERYIPIAQMSFYLVDNFTYYATYEKGIGPDKRMIKLMDDKILFQRQIDYAALLDNVCTKIQTDPEVAKAFDEKSPYSLGLLYGAILSSYDHINTFNTRNGVYPCETKQMQKLVNYVKAFYNWVYIDSHSSFKHLGNREQNQIRDLFEYRGLSPNLEVASYICDIPISFIDKPFMSDLGQRSVPPYQNDTQFNDSLGTSYYQNVIDVEKLLEEKKLHQKKDK